MAGRITSWRGIMILISILDGIPHDPNTQRLQAAAYELDLRV